MSGQRALPKSDKLTSSAVALALTAGVTSLLGLVFWALAAHLYPSEAVGQANALISAGMLLGGFAQLNLSAVNVRFLPAAGPRARRMVVLGYLGTSLLAVLVTFVFVRLGIGEAYLTRTGGAVAGFTLAVITFLWSLLGDSVLIAMRRSQVVLIENSTLAVIKLVVLVISAQGLASSGWGIAASWIVPNLVIAVVVAIYLVVWVMPRPARHSALCAPESSLPSKRSLTSFVAAEYLKSLLTTGAALALPLIVAARLGLSATAHFTVPWLIITAVNVMLYNVSMSFVVEAQYDRDNYAHLLRRAIAFGGALTAAACIVLVFGASRILAILGPQYAQEGTALMRLLALSLPFVGLNMLYGVFVWIETRLWWLLSLQAINVAILLGAALALVGGQGITGVGIAYLIAQAVLGLGSVPPIVQRMRQLRSPAGIPAELVELPRQPARREPIRPVPAGSELW
jgi:O-antigen/teichoic acid export membrane protein